ncbi:hypothetical protein ABW19_dt0202469 [Dactylella cylindrospora]|nr:hypothetical protein ABW19_dt0202469 [Dactylella cylindrospora]
MAQIAEELITPLQRAAAKWLTEDSSLTPIEETLMAMSLIGDTSIPDLYQLMDPSVPDIPEDTMKRANPDLNKAGPENNTGTYNKGGSSQNPSTSTSAEGPPAAVGEVHENALRDHVEQGAALSTPVEFQLASTMLRPICLSWIDKVKKNARSFVSEESLDPDLSVAEVERLGYTSTETREPLPAAVCAQILSLPDDDDPLPQRGHDILSMDWEPVSRIYYNAMPLLWGLFAGTSAFDSVKLYLDDVARIFYLPTLATKYGPNHYFVLRALQSFGMTLSLVCHPDMSADILETAVQGFDKLGMQLHRHTLDCFYQLVQVLPFSRKGPRGIRLAQNFLQRCQVGYGRRHGRTISALALMARGFVALNQKQLAVNVLNQVTRLTDGLLESERATKQYADALRDIGKAEFYAGLIDRSATTLLAALQRNDDLEYRAPDSSHLSFLLGMVHSQAQQWESAITFLRRSTNYRTDTFGELHRSSGSSMEALAVVWEKRGPVLYETPLLDLLEKLYKHHENRFGSDHQRTWIAWLKYGSAAMTARRSNNHEERAREIIEVS